MSHHYSGPNLSFPRGDARLDLTDLYAFPKPGDPGKSILIMNVHPSVGFNPAGPTTDDPFATEVVYELKIDTTSIALPTSRSGYASLQTRVGALTATFLVPLCRRAAQSPICAGGRLSVGDAIRTSALDSNVEAQTLIEMK
jgi:hypothetical protein